MALRSSGTDAQFLRNMQTEIKLYPISLGMTEKRPQKGVPVLTGDENVLSYLAELSKPYGTEMEIKDGVGTIRL